MFEVRGFFLSCVLRLVVLRLPRIAPGGAQHAHLMAVAQQAIDQSLQHHPGGCRIRRIVLIQKYQVHEGMEEKAGAARAHRPVGSGGLARALFALEGQVLLTGSCAAPWHRPCGRTSGSAEAVQPYR